MKKRLSLFFLGCLWTSMTLFAQGTKVTTGVIAYQDARYEEAMSKFQEALSKPELLKPQEIAKANYYLSQCYFKVLTNEELNKKLGAGIPDLENKTYEYYMKAQEGLPNAKGDKSSFTNGLALEKPVLYSLMLNKGSNIYSSVKENDPNAKELLQSAHDFITKAKSLDPTNYLNGLLLGFISLRAQKTDEAIPALEESISLYEKAYAELQKTQGKNAKVDSNMISTYQNLSQLYSDKKNSAKALEVLENGKKIFPSSQELARQELSIYNSDPAYLQQALGKFDESLQKNPNDITVRIAYAELLTRAGKPADGIKQYEMVLQKEPNNFYANANLGAHYVNTAAKISEEMKKAGEKEYEKLDAQVKEQFKAAYPYMKKAQELRPNEVEWIDQMIQITSYLPNMDAEAEMYFKKKQELRK